MATNKLNVVEGEKDILESYNAGEWASIENQEAEASKYREYARATFKKDKRVNIRISSKNLEALQTKVLEEGIPYQTLITSILHKYINRRLVERS